MAGKQIWNLRPVLLEGLRDEMYPIYHFLKKRLLSIYPRFKTECEKLEQLGFQLVTGGTQFVHGRDDNIDVLKNPVHMILLGHHEVISEEKHTWNRIIASSRYRVSDETKLTKQPIADFQLDEEMKASSGLSVIIYFVDESQQSFESAQNYLMTKVPDKLHGNVILCNASFENYATLAVEYQSDQYKAHKTLGLLIQACLDEKVVAVLHEMSKFIKSFVNPANEIKRDELLNYRVSKNVQQISHEIQDGGDKCQTKLDDHSKRGKEPRFTNLGLINGEENETIIMIVPGERIKEMFKNIHDIVQGASVKRRKMALEAPSSKQYLEIVENLSAIDFEINGVLRQAKYPAPTIPDISESPQNEILRIKGVTGCGVMLGKLVVHIDEGLTEDKIDIKKHVVSILMKQPESQYFVNRLEIKSVRLSKTANDTYESGQCLRVNALPDQVSPGCSGTLGCFVVGRPNNSAIDHRQLYGLSCAHVFPDDYDSVVKIDTANLGGNPESTLKPFGIISQQFKVMDEHKVDIAAIEILAEANPKCNKYLKNSDVRLWRSSLHEGSLNDLLGYQVYKWGAVSDFTRGLIISKNYASDGFDNQYNIFIKGETDTSKEFSKKGDSGSAVCYDDPSEETVQIVSLVKGEMTTTSTGEQECSYSVHLKKNLDRLSEQSGHSFELCNPDQ